MDYSLYYEYGDWIPHKNGHFLRCPMCKEDFIGRKNRIYCREACKTKHNNDLAAKRKKAADPGIISFTNNQNILKQFYPQSMGEKEIPLQLLTASGFDPYGLHTPVKLKNQSGDWKKMGKYAYRLKEKNQLVMIVSLNK